MVQGPGPTIYEFAALQLDARNNLVILQMFEVVKSLRSNSSVQNRYKKILGISQFLSANMRDSPDLRARFLHPERPTDMKH